MTLHFIKWTGGRKGSSLRCPGQRPRLIRLHAVILSLTVAIALFPPPPRTYGAEYHSPKGFRLDYPEDWSVASQDGQRAVGEAAKHLFSGVDFSRIDGIIYNPRSPNQNVNIVITPGSVPTSTDTLPKVESGLRQQLSSAGIGFEDLECKLAQISGRDVILSSWISTSPAFGPQKIKQRQYLFAGRDHEFIITCSAGIDNAADAEAAFAQIISSFQIDVEPRRTPGEWWAGQSSVVRGGIAGAAVGAAIGILGGLTKLGKRKGRKPA